MNITLAYDQYLAIHRYKYLALYHALRAGILEGTLPGGTPLPSTRSLAKHYELSRGSVSQVYEMLLADGYVRTETGRGHSYRKIALLQLPVAVTVRIRLWVKPQMLLEEIVKSRLRFLFQRGESGCLRARYPL